MALQKTRIILETDKLISIPKASEIIGVHFTTLYRWVKDGKLNAIKIGGQTYLDAAQVKKMKMKQPQSTGKTRAEV